MSELQLCYESFCEAHWAHDDAMKCGCRGSGWALSDVDTLHPCRFHYDADKPHPEDDLEA